MKKVREDQGRFKKETNPGPGRSSKYLPSMNEQVYRLAILGLTDRQIAVFFDVSETTITNWKRAHPGFLESLNRGKVHADAKVAEGLYRRAVGMELVEEKLICASDSTWQTVQLRKEIPPDTRAAIVWLATRQPALWSSKVQNKKHEAVSEEQNEPEQMSDEELAAEVDRPQKLQYNDG